MTDRTDRTDHIEKLGRLTETGDGWRLQYTRNLAHPPEKVWRALTEAKRLRSWFPTDIEGERTAGAKLRFVFREDQAPPFDGEMLTYDPPRLLEFTWGDDLLRFELAPAGSGTVLTFSDTISELGRAARDGAGWHECLVLLERELDGTDPSQVAGRIWGEVHPLYVESFGPEAATIGPPEGFNPDE